MIQGRKTPYRVSLAGPLSCGVILCLTALVGQAQDAASDPPAAPADPSATPTEESAVAKPKATMGPSARMAAELIKEPPPAPSWVAHYLPEDRYKVAGGIWKYVSTELDTYYHLPNSPLMLRQPNNIVIGFSSREMAEEAGYRADNAVAAQIAASAPKPASASNPLAPKEYSKPTTVTLGDGQSKLTVPAGWKHMKSPSFMKGMSFDIFLPKGSEMKMTVPKPGQMAKQPKMVWVMTMTDPRGNNLESLVKTDFMKQNVFGNSGSNEAMAGLASQNPQLSQFTSMWKDLEVTPSNWGGASAIKIGAKKGSKNTAAIGSSIMAARGSKLYIFQDTTQGDKGAARIRNSFVAR